MSEFWAIAFRITPLLAPMERSNWATLVPLYSMIWDIREAIVLGINQKIILSDLVCRKIIRHFAVLLRLNNV